MYKELTIQETVEAGRGYYSWQYWDKMERVGMFPAIPNLPLACYQHNGEVYALERTTVSYLAGQNETWRVVKVEGELLERLRLFEPNHF